MTAAHILRRLHRRDGFSYRGFSLIYLMIAQRPKKTCVCIEVVRKYDVKKIRLIYSTIGQMREEICSDWRYYGVYKVLM